ncbi:hypothetical protein QZH41_016572, partial [Actinostola sp. cb2023]
MDSDKTSPQRHVNTGPNLELKYIQASGSSTSRSLKTNSTVQPGNLTTVTTIGSQTKSAFQSSFRSDSSLDQTLVSFRDVDAVKKVYHRRLRILSGISCGLGLVAVVLAIVDIEVTRRRKGRSNIIEKADGLRGLTGDSLRLAGTVFKGILSLLSVMTCITIHKIYMNTRRLNIIKNLYHESEGFVTSSLFPKYCIECFVCLIHVPPLVGDLGAPYVYKLQLLVLLRLYLATRCLRERNHLFHNQATNLLASVTKTDISSSFLVKTYFLKEPFKLIFTFYSLNVFLGGYCVYVIEDSHTYLDTTWMMVVTMTTLGFGDVVPVTVFARGLVGFASVLGIFLMALFISVVHETLQLTQQEKRILAYIENAGHLRLRKNVAARCIQSCWRYKVFCKRNYNAIEMGDWLKTQKVKFLQHKFFEQMRLWRSVRRAWSRDDYWKKFFIIDDTAMLLTDVCRTIDKIDRHLGTPQAVKGSKNSLYKNPSIYSPLPKKQDDPEYDRVFDYPSISFASPHHPPSCRSNSVQAVLVESWKSTSQQQQHVEPVVQ